MNWMIWIAIGAVLNSYHLTDARGGTDSGSKSKLCESVLSSFQDRLSRGLRNLLRTVHGNKKITLFLLVTPRPTSDRQSIQGLVEKYGIENLRTHEGVGESNYLEIRGTNKAVLELLGAIQSLETQSGISELEWAGFGLKTGGLVPAAIEGTAPTWKPSGHVQALLEEEVALRSLLDHGADDEVQIDLMFHQDNSRRSNSATVTPDHPRYQWWQAWLRQQFSNQAEGGLPYITAIPYLEALYGTELQFLLSEGIEILKPETQGILLGTFRVRGKLRSMAKVLDRFPKTLPIPPGLEPLEVSYGVLSPEPSVELVQPGAIRVPIEVESVLKGTDPNSITTISLMFKVKSDWEMFQLKAKEAGAGIVFKIILGDESPYLATVQGRSGPLFDLLNALKESEVGAVAVELPPLRRTARGSTSP